MRYTPSAHLHDHDWSPDVRVNTITIETANGGDYEDIMTKRELEKYAAQVRTMYKRKDKKIRPANVPLPDGVNPGGGVNWESIESNRNRVLINGSDICS
jgi:hypothetical protein